MNSSLKINLFSEMGLFALHNCGILYLIERVFPFQRFQFQVLTVGHYDRKVGERGGGGLRETTNEYKFCSYFNFSIFRQYEAICYHFEFKNPIDNQKNQN